MPVMTVLDTLNHAAVCAVRALLRVLLPVHHEVLHFLKGERSRLPLSSLNMLVPQRIRNLTWAACKEAAEHSNSILARPLHGRLYVDAALA